MLLGWVLFFVAALAFSKSNLNITGRFNNYLSGVLKNYCIFTLKNTCLAKGFVVLFLLLIGLSYTSLSASWWCRVVC